MDLEKAVAINLDSEKTSDQRDDIRARLNLRVEYGTAFDIQTTAYMYNIGYGGVFIRTENPLEAGAAIDLEFTLPGSFRTISAQAKVVWSRKNDDGDLFPAGMGLTFTKIGSNDQQALHDYVRKLALSHGE